MAATTEKPPDHTIDRELGRLTSDADDDAAQLAMDVESIADACEVVSRWITELRTDVARQRVGLVELRGVHR